jgi:hypothetical protein
MKVFINSVETAKLKKFQWKLGNQFLCRLIGISLDEADDGDIAVYPVYRAIGIHTYPGQLILSIPMFKKELMVSFSGRGIETIVTNADKLTASHVGKEEE